VPRETLAPRPERARNEPGLGRSHLGESERLRGKGWTPAARASCSRASRATQDGRPDARLTAKDAAASSRDAG